MNRTSHSSNSRVTFDSGFDSTASPRFLRLVEMEWSDAIDPKKKKRRFWLCRSSLEAHRIDRVGVDIRARIGRRSRAEAVK
ncbi:hypothetical protein Scep_022189 [Stephania cephalantha]|uniref:Uncharacterized protein n=1 Tax=Stephania cephalantha TaxID=152367 RepID=A0AAP0I223_9MAGN